MDEKRDGPFIPEHDLTPEKRLEEIGKVLLDAIREMELEKNREKVRRCRARKKGQAPAPEPTPEPSQPLKPSPRGPTYRIVSCTEELPVTIHIERVDPPRKQKAPCTRRGRRGPESEREVFSPPAKLKRAFKIEPPGQ